MVALLLVVWLQYLSFLSFLGTEASRIYSEFSFYAIKSDLQYPLLNLKKSLPSFFSSVQHVLQICNPHEYSSQANIVESFHSS